MANKEKSWDRLFTEYEKARLAAKEANHIQEALKVEIKERLEKKNLEEVDEVDFTCVYKFEKDKEVFDAELFKQKEPKKYQQWMDLQSEMEKLVKKYTKKVPGARKLIITRKNEGEE